MESALLASAHGLERATSKLASSKDSGKSTMSGLSHDNKTLFRSLCAEDWNVKGIPKAIHLTDLAFSKKFSDGKARL